VPARRVLISIDERLLARIDGACERLGLSRSAFLAQSAARDLEGATGPGTDPTARAALGNLDRLLAKVDR
jgi:hypothetical protein